MLDERQCQCLAGTLLHHYDNPGGGGVVGLRDARLSFQADSQQGRMEAEPCGFLQHVGPKLPLWDNLVSGLLPLWTILSALCLPFLHPELLSRFVTAEYHPMIQ